MGGAGFLGSHLVDHLVEDRNCYVLVVDNLCAGRREYVHPRADFEHHDITGSEDHVLRLLLDYSAEYVFNYAAHPYVPDSYERPLRVFDVNAVGAMKVVNAAQAAGCKGILQVSSAELYGEGTRHSHNEHCPDFEHNKIDEMDEVVPHSTYGAAKAAIDAWVGVRWREAETPCIALRQFNCVGERETHPYVVPEIISQLSKVIEVSRPGDLPHLVFVKLGNNSYRDFLYAGDQARIAVELLERGNFGEVYNLGSESGIKMYDLARMIGKLMGFAEVEVVKDQARVRLWEIWSLLSSNEKIYSIIEGRPSTSLEEALKKTIQWYGQVGRRWPWEK